MLTSDLPATGAYHVERLTTSGANRWAVRNEGGHFVARGTCRTMRRRAAALNRGEVTFEGKTIPWSKRPRWIGGRHASR